MAAKVLALAAVPGALGLAALRVRAAGDPLEKERLVSPKQMSVYAPPAQKLQFVEEQPGRLQTGLAGAREGLRPYVRSVKGACSSVKTGVINVVDFVQDTYIYLRDPPPGFLPRVSLMTVSGLAGLVLARKGSRFKKLVFPAGLVAAGAAVCYPAQAVAFLKVTGKKAYAASQWTSGAASSLWKRSAAKPAGPERSASAKEEPSPAPVPGPEPEAAQQSPLADAPLVAEGVASEAPPPTPQTQPRPLTADPASPEPLASDPPKHLESSSAPEVLPSDSGLVTPVADAPTDAPVKARFTPDPRLADHGQASPEDADLYSTRS
ncbi:MICOS complex subunit MIC27 [Lepisosteus oculatus]|uniref:MICOS complex subunit MIC27 n=1 Tax=Lepisosteus oculatus TaxID=7918 RepID=UPI0037233192